MINFKEFIIEEAFIIDINFLVGNFMPSIVTNNLAFIIAINILVKVDINFDSQVSQGLIIKTFVFQYEINNIF